MKLDKLIRMANEIARNLRAQPGDQAVAAIAEHLQNFWTPAMRASLVAHQQAGGAGLDPIAAQAVDRLARS